MEPIRGVAFDVDGTLYPNWQMMVASLPSVIRDPKLAWYFAKARRAIRLVSKIGDFRLLQAEMIAERLRCSVDSALTRVEEGLYQKWLTGFRIIRPYPYVATLLQTLRDAGIVLGVLSDFPIEDKLRFMKLDGYWDAALSSEEVGYLKPDTKPFLALAERMGLSPAQMLYVGNNPHYDAVGANRAGMRSALIGRGNRHHPADIHFTSYRQLEGLILPLLL